LSVVGVHRWCPSLGAIATAKGASKGHKQKNHSNGVTAMESQKRQQAVIAHKKPQAVITHKKPQAVITHKKPQADTIQ